MWISGLEKLAGAATASLLSSLTGAQDEDTSQRQPVADPITQILQHSQE